MKKRAVRIFTLLGFCSAFFLMACSKDTNEKDTEGNGEGLGSVSQKLDSEGLTQEQLDNALEANGNPFESLSAVGTEDPVYCNLPENITSWEGIIPICHDPLYDILYYVDYGGDYTIHMARDGEEKVAVPFPGRRLFCRGGKLYFLMESLGQTAVKDVKSGNILSYDPISGEIEVISDMVFDSMVVFQDMIFCRTIEEREYFRKLTYYSYSFDTKELVQQEEEPVQTYLLSIHRYGGFFLSGVLEQVDLSSVENESLRERFQSYIDDGMPPELLRTGTSMMLCRWGGVDRIPLEGLSLLPLQEHYVKGDNILWLTSDGLLHTYYIPTQQEEASAVGYDGGAAVLAGDILYTSGGYYTDLRSGVQEKCFVMDSGGDKAFLSELYFDGESVYGIAAAGQTERLFCIRLSGREEADEIVQPYWREELMGCQHVFLLLPMDDIWE